MINYKVTVVNKNSNKIEIHDFKANSQKEVIDFYSKNRFYVCTFPPIIWEDSNKQSIS